MAKVASLSILLGLILAIPTSGSFLGQYHWIFDLMSHFHLQYFFGLLLCLLVQVSIPYKRIRILWLLPAIAANLLVLSPFFLPYANVATAKASTLNILTINVFAHNSTPEKVIGYISGSEANVILLSEAQPEFMELVEETLNKNYPYIHNASQRGHFGIALLSQYPLLEAQTNRLGIRKYPSIEATIDWKGKLVKVYGAHPHPPLSKQGTQWRDSELTKITEILAKESMPLILMGDLNTSPWSHITKQFSTEAGLRHAAMGYGIWPTWQLGTILLGAPIDHILVSPHWIVNSYKIGKGVGSDHYPVIANLALP